MKYESFSADGRLFQALMKRSQTVACGEGGTLFHQGEAPRGLFILERGEAALVMTSDAGQAVMCVEAGPGSLLGLPSVIANKPYTATALVRKGSTVSIIAPEDFDQTLREEPELYPCILQVLAEDFRSVRLAIAEGEAASCCCSAIS
jgi:CRP-like cAMP-binding protein